METTDSVYSKQLLRGRTLRFGEDLETLYTQWHLERVRLRVRIWFSLSSVFIAITALGFVQRSGFSNPITLLHLCLLIPTAIALVWLVWGGSYTRYFARLAPLLTSICYAGSGISVGVAIAAGLESKLTFLTSTEFSIFFFSGLMFRQTFLPIGCLIVAFLASAIAFGAPAASLAESTIAMGLMAALCLIMSWDIDWSYRRGFLEGAIIRELAGKDSLTGLMNRRSFDEHVRRIWQQAMRERRPIAVLMIDIDHFKRYNDVHGHLVGDATIRAVARVIGEVARRPLDLAARYGGEEFAVILYDLALIHVQDVAERLRVGVRQVHLDELDGHGGHGGAQVTVSVGVGAAVPKLGRSPEGIIQLADEALYEAKAAGRDRIVFKGVEAYESSKTGTFRLGVEA